MIIVIVKFILITMFVMGVFFLMGTSNEGSKSIRKKLNYDSLTDEQKRYLEKCISRTFVTSVFAVLIAISGFITLIIS